MVQTFQAFVANSLVDYESAHPNALEIEYVFAKVDCHSSWQKHSKITIIMTISEHNPNLANFVGLFKFRLKNQNIFNIC